MSFTNSDLAKLSTIIKEKLKENNEILIKIIDYKFDEFKEEMVTKAEFHELKNDVNKLKDDVAGIRNELNTEHNFRFNKIKDNTQRIVRLEKHLELKSNS